MVLSRSPADYAAWCNCVDTCQLYVLCTARCASAVLILNCIPLARMDGSIYQCYFYTAQSSPDVGVPARCVQHIHLVSKQCHASLGQSSARAERAVVFIDGSRSLFRLRLSPYEAGRYPANAIEATRGATRVQACAGKW